jgi:triacylglycerol lipase
MKHYALALALPLLAASTAASAQLPADVAEGIRAMGAVNDAQATAKAVRHMHIKEEPPRDVIAQRDIAFGPHPLQRLDVFTSEPDPGRGKPILIFVHGGGFTGGDKHRALDFSYDNVMIWAVKNGFVGVNTNYRLAPQFPWPNATQDVAAAVRWARENGARFGGDPNKLVLWGHSAGASLVGGYVAGEQFHVIPGSGLDGAIMTSGGGFEIRQPNAYYADASKLSQMESLPGLLKTNVPLFVTRAELDPPQIADASERLNKALCDAGRCPAVFLRTQGHNHMSQVYTVNTEERTISDQIAAFIKKHAQ